MDYFWSNGERFAKITPHLPTDTRARPRVDDYRVVSDNIQVVKSGSALVDAPPTYAGRGDTLQPLRPV